MLACSNSSDLRYRSFTLAFSMIHGGIDCCSQGVAQESYTFAWLFSPASWMIANFSSHELDLELYWAGGD
jgi:hypothetical protein